MVERIEDLNLPTTVVARLIKEALPPHAAISKEAKAAIARAASVFVIYLTASSTTLARKVNHKTLTSKNILEAMELLEFESFIAPLNEELENYRKAVKEKKDIKLKKDAESAAASTAMDVDEGSTVTAPPTESSAVPAGEEVVSVDTNEAADDAVTSVD